LADELVTSRSESFSKATEGMTLSGFFYWGFGFDSLGSTSKSQRLALKLLD
jgi:hypothetical protein